MAQSPISSEVVFAGDMLYVSRMNGVIRPCFGYGVIAAEATVSVLDH